MNCPQCQQPLRESAPFCPNCGARTGLGEQRISLSDSVPTAPAGAAGGDAPTVIGADPLAGRVLDAKYELLARLGEGGMGAVYRARRVHIGDEVAVKVLHPKFITDESAVERFRREARAAAQLNHPNVVTIHDYGEAKGSEDFAYIVMELVNGISLRDLLRNAGSIEPGRAVALTREICAGVGSAHRRGIIHRDLKPDNIIVLAANDDRERETVKVVDFGIAKLRDMASDHTLTQAGALVGTPYYMAPEQCRGEHLDARADVYSLGALLYEMLAGTPPFTAPSITGVIAKHLTEPPPRVPQGLRVPPALEAVVMRALAKDANARQADATELAREIQAAFGGRPAEPPARPFAPPPSAPAPPPAHVASLAPPPQTSPPPAQVSSQRIPAQTNPPAFTPRTQPPAPPPQQVAPAPARRSSRALLVVGLLLLVLLGLGMGFAVLMMQDETGGGAQANANVNRGGGGASANTSANTSANVSTNAVANANAGGQGAEVAVSDAMQRAEQKVVAGALLTAEDLKGLTPAELRLLRNAAYARHGRMFETPELIRYFTVRPWYQPRSDYNDKMLTDADRANTDLVISMEKGGPPPADAAKVRAQVKDALEGWAETTRSHDIEAHMQYYADTLDTYYLKKGVSSAALRAERERGFERYNDFDVKISNLQITPDPTGTRATAVFDKTWKFTADDKISSGSVRQQLWLSKVGSTWLITGEKELQVYYTNSEDTP